MRFHIRYLFLVFIGLHSHTYNSLIWPEEVSPFSLPVGEWEALPIHINIVCDDL